MSTQYPDPNSPQFDPRLNAQPQSPRELSLQLRKWLIVFGAIEFALLLAILFLWMFEIISPQAFYVAFPAAAIWGGLIMFLRMQRHAKATQEYYRKTGNRPAPGSVDTTNLQDWR